MNASPFETLRSLSAFLETTISANISGDLRAEVRAAAKTLSDLAKEFDRLPALLLAETDAMIALQEEAMTRAADIIGAPASARELDSRRKALNIGDLSELWEVHSTLQGDAEFILVGLQAALRKHDGRFEDTRALTDLASRYYSLFKDQAAARVHWQAVFPANAQPPHDSIKGEGA